MSSKVQNGNLVYIGNQCQVSLMKIHHMIQLQLMESQLLIFPAGSSLTMTNGTRLYMCINGESLNRIERKCLFLSFFLCVHSVVSNIELHLLYPFLLCRLLIWVQFVLILENKILLAAFVFQKLIYTFFGGCL